MGLKSTGLISFSYFQQSFLRVSIRKKGDIQISPEQITSKAFVVSISDAFRSATTTKIIPKKNGHPT
jgi:hypothetical protein|tara:strand:- start:180 stop:380 length:201 start_codon:yes stop_codon:yes gene_type:complete